MKLLDFKTVFFGPLSAGIAAAAWVLMVEFGGAWFSAAGLTEHMIRTDDKLIQHYARAIGAVPESMNELRLFAFQSSYRYYSHDAWGERLEYLRLGKVNYSLRSFGEDGLQNRPSDLPDPGVFRWGPIPRAGLKYDAQKGEMQPRPSVLLFAGADDTLGKWNAKVFTDSTSGSRRLLVRSHSRENFFMMAPHDGVEEFLWLPSQDKIIFTASQSAYHADGVYLWDLNQDQTFNLFSLVGQQTEIYPGSKQKGMYVALSSVRVSNPPSVAVFVMSNENILLDPREFFHPRNLHVFQLGDTIQHVKPDPNADKKSTLFDLSFLGTATVAPDGEATPLQKSWMSLPMGGDWEKAVIAWQEFAASHAKSQLAPYAMWGIASFYSEAAGEAGLTSRNGEIFIGYSTELGNALSRSNIAPGYVRAIGAWMAAKH